MVQTYVYPNGWIAYYKYDNINVCDCCDDCIHKLLNKDKETILNGTTNLGIKNIVVSKLIEDLDTNGKELVEWCVDFLLFKKYNSDMYFRKQNQNQFHKNKYITIWSFIFNFLNIEKNSGYDYVLMSFLDQHKIMEHGSAIRCGWFNDHNINPFFERILSEERKKIIIDWATNAPDEL
jgi:hypothetical protein